MVQPENAAGQPNPHLDDPRTGTEHGVPAGVAREESKGVPDSGRDTSESAPIHPEEETEG